MLRTGNCRLYASFAVFKMKKLWNIICTKTRSCVTTFYIKWATWTLSFNMKLNKWQSFLALRSVFSSGSVFMVDPFFLKRKVRVRITVRFSNNIKEKTYCKVNVNCCKRCVNKFVKECKNGEDDFLKKI